MEKGFPNLRVNTVAPDQVIAVSTIKDNFCYFSRYLLESLSNGKFTKHYLLNSPFIWSYTSDVINSNSGIQILFLLITFQKNMV